METMDRLIIVAGSGRNVGKTACACRLIEKFSGETPIYGLKVSAIHPDEEIYHGGHDETTADGRLFEETRIDLDKDTARMLRAGARRVWYLKDELEAFLKNKTE